MLACRPVRRDMPDPSRATVAEQARELLEPSALERSLHASFAARIRLYGLRHLGGEQAAADLVQMVLMRVLEALRAGRVADTSKLAAYVLGTCRNTLQDLRRAEKKQRTIELASALLSEDTPPPVTSERDVLRLMTCLGRLPERDRQVVRMSFMEDRSAEEIGDRLQLSPGNVRVLRHRALARLYACLENGGGS